MPEQDDPTWAFCCPGCGEPLDVAPESAGQLARCPNCSTEFAAPAVEPDPPVVDDTADEAAEQDRANAFDKLRIANHAALRMGAIRSRSWWMIGLVMSSLVLLDMLGKAIIYVLVWHSWGKWPTFDLALAVLAGLFAWHARGWAAKFKREIDQSALPEPTTPPDFSTLGDGTDRGKHLENVR